MIATLIHYRGLSILTLLAARDPGMRVPDSKPFPLPSEIGDIAGAEGWRALYAFFSRFRPEDDQRFWFYNSTHFPEPMRCRTRVLNAAASRR